MNEPTASGKTLWGTWISLLILLWLTWFASRFDLGVGNTVIALLISGTKMMLVILLFMQVRYNSRVVWIFSAAGFVWLLIMISLTMSDYLTRKVVRPYDQGQPRAQIKSK